MSDNDAFQLIPINKIRAESQVRKEFENLDALAQSMKARGQLVPITVYPDPKKKGHFVVLHGERRLRAAAQAGLEELKSMVTVAPTDNADRITGQLIENMQREDLNPIEEAEGINQMIETYGLTQDQVSKSVGKSRPYITNCLRLLKLPEAIQSFVSEGQLSAGHARAIVSAGNKEKQIALAEKAVKEGLSVRQIEKLAKDSKTGKAKAKPREKNADVKRVENDLKEALGTKVTLNQKGKKGKIEIEYYSKDDLERLIELLKTLR